MPSKQTTAKPSLGKRMRTSLFSNKKRRASTASALLPALEESSSCSLSDDSMQISMHSTLTSQDVRVDLDPSCRATVEDFALERSEQRKQVKDTPPLHTVALIALLIGFFVQRLPSLASLDEIATIETFTNVNFAGTVPLEAVIATRLVLAAIMLGNAASVFLFGHWEADTDYFPGSKLQVAKRIHFRGALTPEGSLFSGLQCISTFTLWCWIVEGSAFFLAGMIPLVHMLLPNDHATILSPLVLRTAIVLWETAAPVSILVSAVVKYALWPMAMEHGENIKLLRAPAALLQHNLNSVAALVEVGLLGGLPVCLGHFALPPLYGILYLLFSYGMMYSWTDQSKQQGAQFFYPFFDTTLGATTSLALVALLAILSMSFGIFCATGHVLTHAEQYIGMVPLAAIVLLSLSVCRVKD